MVWLSLRNTADRSAKSTAGVRLKELISQKNPYPQKVNAGQARPVRRNPADAEPRQTVIEVIRSAQRVEVTFENDVRKEAAKH